jgi:serine/threonine protein phosphatase PrpC
MAINKIFKYSNYSSFGVFDGHGINGHKISKFIKQYFIKFFTNKNNFNSNISNINNNIEIKDNIIPSEEKIYTKLKNTNYFKKICIQSEDQLKKTKKYDTNLSGCTGIILIHIMDKLLCYNIGDSRALYITESNNFHQISIDHKPDLPYEKKRILSMNGRIERLPNTKIGPFRVWLKNEDFPGLAMSRSFGDFYAEDVGVICEPDFFEFDIINEKIKAVVIGSDGLFEFMENEKIKNIILKFINKNDAVGCCKKLVEEAHKSWTIDSKICDDITVIVLFFKILNDM